MCQYNKGKGNKIEMSKLHKMCENCSVRDDCDIWYILERYRQIESAGVVCPYVSTKDEGGVKITSITLPTPEITRDRDVED